MIINTVQDTKSCIQKNKACDMLLGCLNNPPISVSCRIGNECGRSQCCFYHHTPKYCRRCGCEVENEVEQIDYPYYCPHCDENMYSFEVTEQP